MNRRNILQYLASITAAAAALAMPAQAQDTKFPTKPIRLVVGSVAGTLVDQAARQYADKMSMYLKQSVVVENVSGAATLLAVRQVLKAPADGYTLLVIANTFVSLPHINAKAGYEVKDFAPIGEMVRSPALIVTSSSSAIKSLPALIAAAKKNPGLITYGSAGVGTTGHLPVELLAGQAGVKFTHVPYKGIGAVLPDVAGGRVSFLMGSPTSFAEMLKGGGLRGLAISAEKRSPKFPDVPTFRELGYQDAAVELWVGIIAPAGIPPAVKERLADAMEAARGNQELVRYFENAGQQVSNVRTPSQFDAVMRADEAKLSALIKQANIQVD